MAISIDVSYTTMTITATDITSPTTIEGQFSVYLNGLTHCTTFKKILLFSEQDVFYISPSYSFDTKHFMRILPNTYLELTYPVIYNCSPFAIMGKCEVTASAVLHVYILELGAPAITSINNMNYQYSNLPTVSMGNDVVIKEGASMGNTVVIKGVPVGNIAVVPSTI